MRHALVLSPTLASAVRISIGMSVDNKEKNAQLCTFCHFTDLSIDKVLQLSNAKRGTEEMSSFEGDRLP